MNIDTLATELLDVATDALPAVERTFVAGGPSFARTCTQLVTYGSLINVQSQGASGVDLTPMIASCAAQMIPQATLVYSKDCYPMPDGKQLADPAKLTAWSTAWLADVQTLHDAVMAAVLDAQRFGECSTVTIGQATFSGPFSGVASMLLPLTVRQF